ncbi:MAG: pyridoxine 5'-phosphate synthase [Thermodesulfobacteriota bacterium]
MPRLNVNVDHVATIREARKSNEPDPVLAAYISEMAGANGIVVHLREDRRHIQDRDLHILRQTVRTKLNMEMAPTPEMKDIALEVRPDMITLVPEKREEITTEGGLNIIKASNNIARVVKEMKKNGLFLSIFIDPDLEQIKAANNVGADMVEIHTGVYANARNENDKNKELYKIQEATDASERLGLRVSAGHGLNYTNVKNISGITGIEELNIGHSIIANSVLVGVEKAVRNMIALCR